MYKIKRHQFLLGVFLTICCHGWAQQITRKSELDLNQIIETIMKFSNGKQAKEIKLKDSIIIFNPYLPYKQLSYQITYSKNGLTEFIQGDTIKGYTKERLFAGDSIAEHIEYDTHGRITSLGKEFLKQQIIGYPMIKFPIGVTELFNSNGIISGTINYDKIFKYSYQDVLRFLRRKYKSVRITHLKGYTAKNKKSYWKISCYSTSEGFSELLIDAHNGAIISNTHTFYTNE